MLWDPMAAVARSPEAPDAMSPRVPCPFCGGPLHPIAGRCKHCKQDLAAHPSRALPMNGNAPPMSPGLPALAALPSRAAKAVALGAPPPYVAPRAGGAGWLRNWPLLVILVAVVGMVVALVLLILPPRDSTIERSKAPANDRMDTDVSPNRSKTIDPWSSTPSNPRPDPARPDPSPPSDPSLDPSGPSSQARPSPSRPPVDFDDLDADDVYGNLLDSDPGDPDPAPPDLGGNPYRDPNVDPYPDPSDVVTPDLVNPLGSLGSPPPRPVVPPQADRFMVTMISRLCQRAATCGDDPLMRDLCVSTLRSAPRRAPACYDASWARQCLRAIDQLPCDRPPQMSTLQDIPACVRLLTC